MARYIDIEPLMKNGWRLERCGKSNVLLQSMSLADVPTADVAPRAEVERLERILNSYALQYGTVRDQQKVIDEAKSEVAREIFEEIEKYILENCCVVDDDVDRIWKHIAELKKKYTEGE